MAREKPSDHPMGRSAYVDPLGEATADDPLWMWAIVVDAGDSNYPDDPEIVGLVFTEDLANELIAEYFEPKYPGCVFGKQYLQLYDPTKTGNERFLVRRRGT